MTLLSFSKNLHHLFNGANVLASDGTTLLSIATYILVTSTGMLNALITSLASVKSDIDGFLEKLYDKSTNSQTNFEDQHDLIIMLQLLQLVTKVNKLSDDIRAIALITDKINSGTYTGTDLSNLNTDKSNLQNLVGSSLSSINSQIMELKNVFSQTTGITYLDEILKYEKYQTLKDLLNALIKNGLLGDDKNIEIIEYISNNLESNVNPEAIMFFLRKLRKKKEILKKLFTQLGNIIFSIPDFIDEILRDNLKYDLSDDSVFDGNHFKDLLGSFTANPFIASNSSNSSNVQPAEIVKYVEVDKNVGVGSQLDASQKGETIFLLFQILGSINDSLNLDVSALQD